MLLFNTAFMVDDILFYWKWIRDIIHGPLVVPRSGFISMFLLYVLGSITWDTCNRHMLVTTVERKLKGD
jgi:hypothetical protein